MLKSILAIVVSAGVTISAAHAETGGAGAGASNIGDARGGGNGGGGSSRGGAADGAGGRGGESSRNDRSGRSPSVESRDTGHFDPMDVDPSTGRGSWMYDDGSSDRIMVDERADTYIIERTNDRGEVSGHESGRWSGYRDSGPPGSPSPHQSEISPAPLENWIPVGNRCVTNLGISPPGPVQPLNSPCWVATPHGPAWGFVIA